MLKKFVAPVVVTGALLGGLAASTSAYAATPPAAASGTAHAGKQPLRAWLRTHRVEIRHEGALISAETIGVTPQVLLSELHSGKSIAEVAGEHNVSPQTVVDALDSAADAKITQAVTGHTLTQTQAQKIEAVLPKYLTSAVNRVR